MEKITIDDIDMIVSLVIERVKNKTYGLPAIVGYYGTIQEALNLLIKRTDFELVGADFWETEYNGYDEAYVLFIYDNEISVRKAYSEELKRYLVSEADYAFVEEDFADEYLKVNPKQSGVIFGFDDVDDHMCDSTIHLCINDDHKGFCSCRLDDETGDREQFVFECERVLSEREIFDKIGEYFEVVY